MAGHGRRGDAPPGAAPVLPVPRVRGGVLGGRARGTGSPRRRRPTDGCGRSRSSKAGGLEAAPATSALSAVETFTARSAVEGASRGAAQERARGRARSRRRRAPDPGNSVTGAAKKRGTKPEVAPRSARRWPCPRRRARPRSRRSAARARRRPAGGGGATTVSSVAVAESTRAGWPANVTVLASGLGPEAPPLEHDPVADRARGAGSPR